MILGPPFRKSTLLPLQLNSRGGLRMLQTEVILELFLLFLDYKCFLSVICECTAYSSALKSRSLWLTWNSQLSEAVSPWKVHIVQLGFTEPLVSVCVFSLPASKCLLYYILLDLRINLCEIFHHAILAVSGRALRWEISNSLMWLSLKEITLAIPRRRTFIFKTRLQEMEASLLFI